MSDISLNEDRGENLGQGRDADLIKGELSAARDKLGDAAHTIRAEAAHFAEATKEKASDTIEQGQETLANAVGDFAEAIRKAGAELADKDQTMVARLVTQAAEGLETFSRAASEKSPEEMLNLVRDFGRSNPTAFLAGSVLAGLALGRFARSSAGHDPSPDKAEPSLGSGSEVYQSSQQTRSEQGFPSAPYRSPEPAGSDFEASDLGGEPSPLTESAGAGVLGEDPDDQESSLAGN